MQAGGNRDQPAGGIPVLRHQDDRGSDTQTGYQCQYFAPPMPQPGAAGAIVTTGCVYPRDLPKTDTIVTSGCVYPPDRPNIQTAGCVYLPTSPPDIGFVPPPASKDEEWLSVSHGATFPTGARLVQAMDRPLTNNDRTANECFVAMWMKNGEPVFGRAWNNNGKVEAWFPHGGEEHHSGGISSSFQLLTYYGPPRQNFRYAWVPVEHMNPTCQPVRYGDYSPAVVTGIAVRSFEGEMLGKCNLTRKMAWVSHDGKEHNFEGDKFNKAHVLCRVPL